MIKIAGIPFISIIMMGVLSLPTSACQSADDLSEGKSFSMSDLRRTPQASTVFYRWTTDTRANRAKDSESRQSFGISNPLELILRLEKEAIARQKESASRETKVPVSARELETVSSPSTPSTSMGYRCLNDQDANPFGGNPGQFSLLRKAVNGSASHNAAYPSYPMVAFGLRNLTLYSRTSPIRSRIKWLPYGENIEIIDSPKSIPEPQTVGDFWATQPFLK